MLTTQQRIGRFFDFYRQRVVNVELMNSLKPPAVNPEMVPFLFPEQHVCISAGLDSLAKFWGHFYLSKRPPGGDREQMGEFLRTHADKVIFERCSGPDLLRRAQDQRTPKGWGPALQRRLGISNVGGLVRTWRNDPTLSDLVNDSELSKAQIGRDWLKRSCYGEVLYEHYRSNWLHEFERSAALGPHDYAVFDLPEPHYQNLRVGDSVMKRLILPYGFLIETYRRVIDSFERQCMSDSFDPSLVVLRPGPSIATPNPASTSSATPPTLNSPAARDGSS